MHKTENTPDPDETSEGVDSRKRRTVSPEVAAAFTQAARTAAVNGTPAEQIRKAVQSTDFTPAWAKDPEQVHKMVNTVNAAVARSTEDFHRSIVKNMEGFAALRDVKMPDMFGDVKFPGRTMDFAVEDAVAKIQQHNDDIFRQNEAVLQSLRPAEEEIKADPNLVRILSENGTPESARETATMTALLGSTKLSRVVVESSGDRVLRGDANVTMGEGANTLALKVVVDPELLRHVVEKHSSTGDAGTLLRHLNAIVNMVSVDVTEAVTGLVESVGLSSWTVSIISGHTLDEAMELLGYTEA